MSEMNYKGFIEREIKKEVKRWCIDNSFGWFDYEIGALIPEIVRPYRIRYKVIVRFSGEQLSIDDDANVNVREDVEYKILKVAWVASEIRVWEGAEE